MRWLHLLCLIAATGSVAVSAAPVPVVYCTDLFHPPDDPDDHFDLATLFALPELDVRAIILDLGQQQRKEPGSIPLRQILHLTGRQVPYASGLLNPLRYPEDPALDQFDPGGPDLILRALRQAPGPVRIITTGSVRDVAAAFNRDAALFRSKVERIYVNAGNSAGGDLHWNPRLDPQAYLRLMRSDLPVYWVPCFGGPETLATLAAGPPAAHPFQSYWRFRQAEVLAGLPQPLLNFFLYALARRDPQQDDPIAWLGRPADPALQERIFAQTRNMWSTVSLLDAAGRRVYRHGPSWRAATSPGPGDEAVRIYRFEPARVRLDADLRTTHEPTDAAAPMRILHVLDTAEYGSAMRAVLRQLLREFPLARAGRAQKALDTP